ncbi:hypothetical protein [Tsuneonella sp. HG222]
MATIPFSRPAESEARFFFIMACVMAGANVVGFGMNAALGRSSFGAPWLVHFHAWVMMGWMGLYVAQNALIYARNNRLHRRIGWIAAAWLPLVAIMGVLITRASLQSAGGPPFFDQNQFMFSNTLQLAGVIAMVVAAIAVRANTGWHRRLMFCAFAILTGPGLGRILPMPFLIPYAWWVGSILVPMIFPAIGMLADKRRYGRVHPAWLVGIGTFVAIQIVADLVAYSDWGIAFTQSVIAGTPGANRPMEAFFPPM